MRTGIITQQTPIMRKVIYALASTILLANQVLNVNHVATAQAAIKPVLETKTNFTLTLNTKSHDAVEIVDKTPDFDAEVLTPLRAKQAQREAEAKAAEARAAAARVAHIQTQLVAVLPAGSHSDWMRDAGIAESDYGYVDYIISRESGWGVTKSNYSGSGAYGLGQALPASKMAAYGSDYLTNPVTQLKWANAYALGRFGSWASAYNHWLSAHSW